MNGEAKLNFSTKFTPNFLRLSNLISTYSNVFIDLHGEYFFYCEKRLT